MLSIARKNHLHLKSFVSLPSSSSSLYPRHASKLLYTLGSSGTSSYRYNARYIVNSCHISMKCDASSSKNQVNNNQLVRLLSTSSVKEDADGWVSVNFTEEEVEELKKSVNNKGVKKEVKKDSQRINNNKESFEQMKKEATSNAQLTPRNYIRGFLEVNPLVCSGCGTQFQSKAEDSPGFLPKEKLVAHREEAKIIIQQQDALKILDMAGIDPDSQSADEILTQGGVDPKIIEGVKRIGRLAKGRLPDLPVEDNADVLPEDTVESAADFIPGNGQFNDIEIDHKYHINTSNYQDKNFCICQRCYKLQHHGSVLHELRPGWSKHELLLPERFEQLLGKIKDTKGVLLCLIDIFDVQGSLLQNLKEIAGRNPVIIAANKIDLIPTDAAKVRIKDWIYYTIKTHCNMFTPTEAEQYEQDQYQKQGWYLPMEKFEGSILRKNNIHLISCATGEGVYNLVDSIMALSKSHGEKIYVMGAANVGKSSLINRLLVSEKSRGKKHKSTQLTPRATVSNLPGTTLDFLKILLPNGITIVDTPGLINPGQLTAKLSMQELKTVIPSKQIQSISMTLKDGGCVLLGGLAKVELINSRPFLLAFFVSNHIKLHLTSSVKADEAYFRKHVGTLLTPPESVERWEELGPYSETIFEVEGDSWKASKHDIVIAGLGWVSVTGVGTATIKVTVPQGTYTSIRPSLLPFEGRYVSGKFTGSKFVQKSSKPTAIKTKAFQSNLKAKTNNAKTKFTSAAVLNANKRKQSSNSKREFYQKGPKPNQSDRPNHFQDRKEKRERR